MAQDAERVDGLPTVASPDASGSYSPCSNVHLKQEHSLCTTQAPLAAITDISPGASGAYLPAALPPHAHQARRSADAATSSHDQGGGTDWSTRRASSPTPQQPVLGQHSQFEGYGPGSLLQRMQDFQTSHSTNLDGYSPADAAPASRPSLGYCTNNRTDGLPAPGLDAETQPVQEWLAWGPCMPLQEGAYQQSHHPANHFDLASTAGGSHQDIRRGDLLFATEHGTYEDQSRPPDGIPMAALSPCSSSLATAGHPVSTHREKTAPLPDAGMDMDDEVYASHLYEPPGLVGSRSSAEPAGGKNDEPYAQLIYRAFMSRDNKSMTLQEIYQWFRENTDKAKSTGKGWQNSIRHNLSMNGAFTKRCSNQPPLNSDGSLSLDAPAADGRKSTEWYLEPSYYDGVESTTRYRKGNSKGAVRAHHRGERAADGSAKAVSGRKGGYQAAHNRKRTKAEHQEAARQRNQTVQPHGPPFYTDEDGCLYPGYPAQPAPNTSSPYQVLNRRGGMPRGRRGHLSSTGYFQLDLGGDAHGVHEGALPGDMDAAAEPTTPPGPGHDAQVDDLSYGIKYPQPYVPGFFTHPGGGYHQHQHQHAAMTTAGAMQPPPGYPQQPAYTLHQVEGVFEPPSGIEPPLFLSGNTLTGDEAAALMAPNPPWANAGPYCG